MKKTQHIVALLLLLMITPCSAWAQKKELNQARSYIKSGKDADFEKAAQLMTELLKNVKNKGNKKIYQTWFEAVRGQYVAANERIYLKHKQDTAKFFDLNREMFVICEALDSIDMRPDTKGRVSLEYREKHAELLNTYRPNLFNAGTYHLHKGDYAKAFSYFEFYMDCAHQPLFTAQEYATADRKMPEVAYWATYCGYKMNDAVLTLRHRQLALTDSSKLAYTYQYIAEARRWLNDQELYLQTLEKGFQYAPTSPYFFPRLMDAYSQKGLYEKALALTDSAIASCDTCELYLFVKSTMLFRLQRYTECIKVSDQVIAINPNQAEAHFNAGTAYLNLALQLDERKEKKQLRQLYQKARPYMERYRQLAPNEKLKWGPALYRIYLNLNMGKQFDEIDHLLKKSS
jgi:tetratricopeptide (TPR) repeat protein